jgi:hypothetical protein
MMITDLAQVEELKVVERLRLNMLMEELNLSRTGLMEEDLGPRLGKLLGARNLVKGSYLVMGDRKMTLDAGVYALGELMAPSQARMDGDLSRLFRMEKELVLRIMDHFQIQLTPQERERILLIPTENMMAFLSYCQGLEALDRGDFGEAHTHFSQAVQQDPNFQQAQDQLLPAQMWEVTHNRNLVRVNRDVEEMIDRLPVGRPERVYAQPALVSTWGRLQRMGQYQNSAFLPGNDARESIQEASISGAYVIPVELPLPPDPPTHR